MTARLIINASNYVSTYTSIDKNVDAHQYVESIISKITYFQTIQKDYQDISDDIKNDFYDVVIIDIEPHFNEIKIYEKIKQYMQPIHLCILKHIGSMDMFGSSYADKFLGHYIDQHIIYDYFPEACVGDDFRDIVVIMTKTSIDSNLHCADMARGEISRWCDENTPRIVKTFVL